MKVDLTREQLDVLKQIVDRAQITGQLAERIVEIKRALKEATSNTESK